jgi:hypothetical protein
VFKWMKQKARGNEAMGLCFLIGALHYERMSALPSPPLSNCALGLCVRASVGGYIASSTYFFRVCRRNSVEYALALEST